LPVSRIGCFILPIRAATCSRCGRCRATFRGRLVSALRIAAKAGELTGIDPGAVLALLDALMAEQWVVYAKPCLEHTESVIGYLARYTHRIALGNARILGPDDDQVSLRYRDGEHKTLTLEAPELIRRCLLHLLPQGLMRVRHYGLLGNRCRVQRLAQIRKILAVPPPERQPASDPDPEHQPGSPYPVCRRGRMRPLRKIPRAPRLCALSLTGPRHRAPAALGPRSCKRWIFGYNRATPSTRIS